MHEINFYNSCKVIAAFIALLQLVAIGGGCAFILS